MFIRLARLLAALGFRAGVAAFVPFIGTVAPSAADDRIAALQRVLDRLSPQAVARGAALAEALGIPPLQETDGTTAFAAFEARDLAVEGFAVARLELRAPRRGSEARAGPILLIELDLARGPCLPREQVLDRLPAEPFAPGSPHASDPDDSWRRRIGAADLYFGFPSRGPDCLRSLVYRIDDPS